MISLPIPVSPIILIRVSLELRGILTKAATIYSVAWDEQILRAYPNALSPSYFTISSLHSPFLKCQLVPKKIKEDGEPIDRNREWEMEGERETGSSKGGNEGEIGRRN